MDAQIELRQIISEEFLNIKARNGSYSLRAFATRIGLVPSAVSEILSGKRRITKKMAKKILERLSVPPDKTAKIIGSLNLEKIERNDRTDEKEFLRVNMDQYHVISEWYYFAIVSLAETEGFKGNSKWIASRLNIPIRDAEVALDRLERLGMLKKVGGKLVSTGLQFETTSDMANLSLRKNHYDNLELAKKSLETDDVLKRDFSSMTMAIDPKQLPEAKKLIKNFRRKLCAYLEAGSKKEVYRICVQLFPLSKENVR